MRKSSKMRLTLHRETLRTLAGPEIDAAQGGNNSAGCPTYTIYITCTQTGNCPTHLITCATGCCPTTSTLLC
jgi:hypothetical protein